MLPTSLGVATKLLINLRASTSSIDMSKLFSLFLRKEAIGSLLSALAILVASGQPWQPAEAAITVTGRETALGVSFEYSGSIDLTGLSVVASGTAGGFVKPQAPPTILLGFGDYTIYGDVFKTQPSALGPGSALTPATSNLGSIFGVQNDDGIFPDLVAVPASYTTGLLNGSSIFDGATFNTLGLARGVYQWTLSNDDTVVLTVVPEPLTLLGASAAVAWGVAFKRRKSV
ncbi:MAG: PEP-CTERM sorting domain-containing protein [Cyanobacteria bacterium RI_101]|nr:PEP-CTERM sorting domain-containing protein [Cyanobacteria bacterium RI_101]